jgi:haemagglutination activity domain
MFNFVRRPADHAAFASGSSKYRTAIGSRRLRPALLAGTSAAVLLTLLSAGGPADALCLVCSSAPANPATSATSAMISSSQQAAQMAQQAISALNRASQAIQAMQAVQANARAAASAGPNNLGLDPKHPGQPLLNVPDGMSTAGAGGLVPDSGLSGPGIANPVTTWVGANTPTQSTSSGLTSVTIQQTAPQALLNWTTFNVGKNTIVNFSQGASTWVALNRIMDPSGSPSQISGKSMRPAKSTSSIRTASSSADLARSTLAR